MLERDNLFQVGQSGLIGNPAAVKALDDCDLLLMVGTDFPYSDWYPTGKTVVQIDARGAHIGRRTAVELGLVGHAVQTTWRDRQLALTADPDVDKGWWDGCASAATTPRTGSARS